MSHDIHKGDLETWPDAKAGFESQLLAADSEAFKVEQPAP
jgi:hypothetical protein